MNPELKLQIETAEKEVLRYVAENGRVLVKYSELAEIVYDKKILRKILTGYGTARYYRVLGGRDPVYVVIIETPNISIMLLIDELKRKYIELRRELSPTQALSVLNKYAVERLVNIFYNKYSDRIVNKAAYYSLMVTLKYGLYVAEYYSGDVKRYLVGGTWLEIERLDGVYVFRHIAAE